MARLPKSVEQAVGLLRLAEGMSVVAVGPANGYVEALADVVGTKGAVLVTDPPPDLSTRKKAVKVTDDIPDDVAADAIILWMGSVAPHEVRDYLPRLGDDGTLWVVYPRTRRDSVATLTDRNVKRAMLAGGFREIRDEPLSVDAHAVCYGRRRR